MKNWYEELEDEVQSEIQQLPRMYADYSKEPIEVIRNKVRQFISEVEGYANGRDLKSISFTDVFNSVNGMTKTDTLMVTEAVIVQSALALLLEYFSKRKDKYVMLVNNVPVLQSENAYGFIQSVKMQSGTYRNAYNTGGLKWLDITVTKGEEFATLVYVGSCEDRQTEYTAEDLARIYSEELDRKDKMDKLAAEINGINVSAETINKLKEEN